MPGDAYWASGAAKNLCCGHLRKERQLKPLWINQVQTPSTWYRSVFTTAIIFCTQPVNLCMIYLDKNQISPRDLSLLFTRSAWQKTPILLLEVKFFKRNYTPLYASAVTPKLIQPRAKKKLNTILQGFSFVCPPMMRMIWSEIWFSSTPCLNHNQDVWNISNNVWGIGFLINTTDNLWGFFESHVYSVLCPFVP